MYKLLIVDDEPLVLMGLQSMLPWSDLDITICGTAANGKQALELIHSLHPDLVITDIKMPVMDGLELLEHCQKELEQPPEFIILTCYEDFPYIRTALRYRAVDYIIKLGLKPEELRASVEQALKNMKEKAPTAATPPVQDDLNIQNYKEKFLLKLLNNLFESTEQFTLQAKQFGFSFDADYYVAAACTMNHLSFSPDDEQYLTLCHSTLSMLTNILSKYTAFHLVSMDTQQFYLLFQFEKDSTYLDSKTFSRLLQETFQMIENYFNMSVFCAVGDYKHDILLISESHQEARQLLPLCSSQNPILFFQDQDQAAPLIKNTFNLTILKSDIQKAFEEYDMQAFQHIIESIDTLFRAHPTSYTQAMDVTSNILHMCLATIPDIEGFLSEKFARYHNSYRSLYGMKTTGQILEWLDLFSSSVMEFYRSQYKELKNTLIENIVQYIDTHLDEKLVLNDVAALFSISPNYLGHLFKKHTSLGFNEYVTQAKISRAKYLMFHTDMKMYEIATQLGFENSFYFSRVFKKIEGCSPRQYMQGCSPEE